MPNKGTPRPRWTSAEDDVIRASYPDLDACERGLAEIGCSRNRNVIAKRARNLGLAGGNEPWSESEDAILRKVYPAYGPSAVVDALKEVGSKRTLSAVTSHANNMGVKRDEGSIESRWSDEETEIVLTMYQNHTAQQISDVLASKGYDRSLYAVSARARTMGLSRNPIRRQQRAGEMKVLNIVLDTILDSDVLDALTSKKNRSMYVRELVRRDLASQK